MPRAAKIASGMRKPIILAVLALGTLGASGQSSVPGIGAARAAVIPPEAAAESSVPGFDAARLAFSQTGNMDLDHGNGDFSLTQFEALSFLCHPISPISGLSIMPLVDYQYTRLNFDHAPAGFPMHDEDLNALNLSSYVMFRCAGSPWIYGGWARAQLATDFHNVNGDDFTFDIAAGAGYRFNERFTLGAGTAVININGDTTFYPGINFDWIASEHLRLGLYGPTLIAAYSLDDDWLLTFRGDPGGGVWNVTGDAGASRAINLTSYRLGLFVSRRLTRDIWLTAGAGATVFNQIDYTLTNGSRLFKEDAGSALFGTIALRVKAW